MMIMSLKTSNVRVLKHASFSDHDQVQGDVDESSGEDRVLSGNDFRCTWTCIELQRVRVAVAHLRDVLPKLSVAVEKIASLPALAKEIPSLMPRLLPVFAIMAFGGGNVATERKRMTRTRRSIPRRIRQR